MTDARPRFPAGVPQRTISKFQRGVNRKMTNAKKRLAVLRMLDTTGIVDDYVYTLMDGMRNTCGKLMVFCSNKADSQTIAKLGQHADWVFAYDNVHFSDGCFVTECSYKIMSGFEEVVFLNDGIFGPIYPLEPMFEAMSLLGTDFWGITRSYEQVTPEGVPVPGTVQDYFLVLTQTVLQSDFFRAYWAGAKDGPHFIHLLANALCYNGFHWDTYLDTSIAKGRFPDENYDPSIWFAYDLLHRQQMPFVRVDALANTYFLPGGNETPTATFRFIKEHTDYDIGLVWQHLLRTQDLVDLKAALHLEKVLPSECAISTADPSAKHTAAIIAHLYYLDLLEDCMDYLRQVPSWVDIYIVSSSEAARNFCKKYITEHKLTNFRVREKNNRGRDFSALLVACKDILLQYDYLCFIHDKKSHAHSPVPSGKTWLHHLWSCTLQSCDYVENIFRTFEADPYLGFLCPPEPTHAEAIAGVGFTWAKDFEETKKLLQDLHVSAPVHPDKHPITLGTVFWCKTKALAPLFRKEYRYEDFPDEPMAIDGTICHAMERCFGYVAQSQGYYTAYIMPPEYAALRASMMTTYLGQTMTLMRDLNIWDRRDGGVVFIPDKASRVDEKRSSLLTFAYKHKNLYIYGAGVYGKDCCKLLQQAQAPVKGFVVSELGKNPSVLMDLPVIELKDLDTSLDGLGVIVALKRQFRTEVVPTLLANGMSELAFYPPVL